ncbi:MAG: OmpH family outer membrane protein [Phycisphaerales bacterium]|nr:OmpH family outer membrane protein [Phycisphaerales bacterium]
MRITTTIVAASVLSSALTAFFISGIDHTASARVDPAATDLGPADGLVLTGKETLRVTNEAGRLGWSDQPGSRAFSLGTVHVGRILNALMKSDKYQREREEFDAARAAKGKEFESRYKELMEKAQGLTPESPEFPAMREEFEGFQKEASDWNNLNETEGRAMVARHYQGAYADLRAAVDVVADRRKIDLVMRFVPPAEEIKPGDESEIGRQLLARTFLRSPDAIDITEDILTEMNVQAPVQAPKKD